jgi:hypothetical protein
VRAATEKIVYEESVRLLASQESNLAGLRARAGTLLAAASLVTAFLAPPALEANRNLATVRVFDGLAWAATGCFVGLVIVSLAVLWPYKWTFGHDAHKLMDDLLDTDPPADEETLLRHLSYWNDVNHTSNLATLRPLFFAFGLGCVLLAAEIGLWLAALTT